MRVIYFGSGEFGLPTLRALLAVHDVVLVVTQPDRPAGRRRALTPTPISRFSARAGLPVIKPEEPNSPEVIAQIDEINPRAMVVIAYGHKIRPALIGERFAINLHASLLPKYRGAAPISRAIMNNERETGVSVITLAQRMDAGEILAQRSAPIDPMKTAGEMEPVLSELGPDAVLGTLDAFERGRLNPQAQDESQATRAPKLSKAEGTVSFDQPAALVRARVHGLTPWPGCTVMLAGKRVKLLRVGEVPMSAEQSTGEHSKRRHKGTKPRRHEGGTPPHSETGFAGMTGDGAQSPEVFRPGTILPDGTVACAPGAIEILSLQPPGGRMMSFEAFRRGQSVPAGALAEPPADMYPRL